MLTLYLVRHGETVSNIKQVVMHSKDDLLTDGGILEATLLGQHLSDEIFTRAYCSDYPRTVNTAELVLKENKNSQGLDLKKTNALREIDIDGIEGTEFRELFGQVATFMQKGSPIKEFVFQGGETESAAEVQERAKSFLQDLMNEVDKNSAEADTVLIVSHGFFIKCFLDAVHEHANFDVVNWDGNCGKVMKSASYMKLLVDKKDRGMRKVEFVNIHENSHLASIPGTDSLSRIGKTPEGAALSGCLHV